MSNRRYIIMNRSALEGYQKGYFDNVPPCFYQEAYVDDEDIPRFVWTPVMGEACRFNSENDAWNFARATWGLKFVNTNYMVVSVHHDGLNRSFNNRELIMERYSNG